jgi:HlyD family secretion protein
MASGRSTGLIVLGLILLAGGLVGYWLWQRQSTPPLIGVVHATEVRVAPEIGGSLVEVKVHKGNSVHVGDVVAKLSAVELTASVEQARAALVKATADRNNVYAGMREEQRASLAA